jgi:anti-sigma B factor antagonist
VSATLGSLDITVVPSGHEVVLHLTGEVDLATVTTLDATLMTAMIAGSRLVVDMAGVVFFDSSGARVLRLAAERARESGAAVVIRNPRPIDRKVFALLGLETVLDIEGAGG